MYVNFNRLQNVTGWNSQRSWHNRDTLEYLGIWEQMHNPNFKGGEFATFKTETGLNSFHMTTKKWIASTQAVGIQSRAGRELRMVKPYTEASRSSVILSWIDKC